jgi:hypothetical protein
MNLSIIARIQKLLILANDAGATEAEAQLAMEKAQAIMSEHNLTMATISAQGGKGTEARAKEGLDGQAMFDYQRDLMFVIAETNYCYVSVLYKYTRRGNKGAGYRIIGTESNVASCKIMFEYLMQTINRLVMIEIGNDHRQRMSRYAISWCSGCSSRLRERIADRHNKYLAEQKKKADEEKRKAQHPASATHGALVVVMEDYAQKEADLNADFRNGWEPGTTARQRSEREAKAAEKTARKFAEAKAAGFDDEVAKTFSEYYFDNPQAAYDWLHPSDEKLAENEKYWEKEAKKAETRRRRELAKRDWHAYGKGSKAGDSISLDRQVSNSTPAARIK